MKRLAEVEARYEELTSEISDPGLLSDMEKYARLNREHSELRELVDVVTGYRRALGAIEEARALLGDAELGALAREELDRYQGEATLAEAKIKELLAPKDPLDAKNAILEVRAGTGGEEAALFAAELYRMYERYAAQRGWKVEVLSINDTGIGGLKEIITLFTGKGVYGRLKFESGAHRVQRVPVTESSGRIHTSAVTVAVMPEADDVDVQISPDDLRMDVYRASGAGGQHVNKTESAVRITHIPSGIVVACQDEKSQHKNRAKALKILQAKLFEQLQEKADSERSQTRKALVGSGDRSERIRTYNYPQGRVTDHRINLTIYKLAEVLEGFLDQVLDPILSHAQAEALAHGEN